MNYRRDASAILVRWYVPLSIGAIFFGILLSPTLSGTRFIYTDAAYLTYPFVTFQKTHLLTSGALWNNLNFHGFPSLLLDGMLFHPVLNALLVFLQPDIALHWTIYLQLVIGALLFNRVMLKIGLSPEASLLCGVLYPLTLWSWVFALSIQTTIPLLAGLLWCQTHLRSHAILRHILVMILLSTACLLLHIHYLAMMCIVGLAVELWYAMQGRTSTLTLRMLKPVGIYSICILCATLLGSVRLLPIGAYALLSTRIGWSSANDIIRSGYLGLGDITFLFLPNLPIPFLTQRGELQVYLGVFAPIFFIIAITKKWGKSIFVRTCSGVIFSILILLLPFDGLRQLVYRIPLVGLLGSPTRFLFLALLATIPLIGIGMDTMAQQASVAIRRWGVSLFVIVGILFLCSALATSLPWLTGNLSDIVDWIKATSPTLNDAFQSPTVWKTISTIFGIGSIRVFPSLIIILIAGWCFMRWNAWTTEMSEQWRRLLLVTIAITSLLPPYLVITRLSYIVEAYDGKTEVVQELQRVMGKNDLMIPYFTGDRSPKMWQEDASDVRFTRQYTTSILMANMNLYWNIPSVAYFDPLASKRMSRFLGMTGLGMRIAPNEQTNNFTLSDSEKVQRLKKRPDILDILNVTHIVSFLPLEEAGYRRIAAFPIAGLKPRFSLGIFENPHARPLAYFVKNVQYLKIDSEAAYGLLVSKPWADDSTFVECEGCEGAKRFSGEGKIDVEHPSTTEIEIRTHSSAEQQLILSTNNLPGWQMTLDGAPVSPDTAYSVYPSITVPAGDHEIRWHFDMSTLLKDSLKVVLGTYRL